MDIVQKIFSILNIINLVSDKRHGNISDDFTHRWVEAIKSKENAFPVRLDINY